MDATTYVSTELVLDLLMPGDAPVPVTARMEATPEAIAA